MSLRFFQVTVCFCLLAGATPAAPQDTLSPAQVMLRFDSLLSAGADSEARVLCTGTALRMFFFLAEAQHKFAPFLDSARSRDTVIEEKYGGKWCGLKVVSDAVFRKPLMGMSRMRSVQAVHLFRCSDGWKVAEFEELPDEKAVLILRHGIPTGTDTASSGSLFPVSSQSPDHRGATIMHLKISLRNGDSLPDLPQGPGQSVVKRGKEWAEVEASLPSLTPREGRRETSAVKSYLGSGSYLDLSDSLLLAKADELRSGARDESEIVRRIYGFVSSSFHFKLGAALFNNSREALRTMEGDCSEAAVLTAALLRAEGIPSRVAMGFATLGRGVFIGHAWAEAFLNGQWIGVDPALREFPAGAERLMLARLSGSEDMRVAASNLMLLSLSNLDIQITGAWNGDKPLPLREQRGNADEAKAFFEDVLRGIQQ
jgi:hypothetical protein